MAELIAFGLGWRSIVAALIMLLLVVFVSRGRSRAARWIFTVTLAYYLLMQTYDVAAERLELDPFDWALMASAIVQLWLVWSRGTSRWIASRGEGDARQPR